MTAEEQRRERQEVYEELRRTEDISGSSNFLMRGLSNATGWEMDYGGWYSPTYTGGDNGTDRQTTTPDMIDHTWEHDMRMFMRVASRTKKTKFYMRVKTTSTGNSGAGTNLDRHDWVQPTFDMLYLEYAATGRTFKHMWTFGRQYAQVERGISFGMAADGIRYNVVSRRNDLQFFALFQPPGDDNIDPFVSGWIGGRTKRMFGGAEWQWKFFSRHTMDLFAVKNIDRNFDKPDGGSQRHQLDSLYYGLGFSGGLTGRLNYWTVYIMETGKTYANGAGSAKINVNASAYDLGLRYFFPTSLAPALYVEYAAGSGDKDATGSATSTAGGSTVGKDERFISFGGMSLGYALSPQLINIKVGKIGASIKPFGWSSSRLWQEIVLQPTFYTYRKDAAAGAISDLVASQTASKVGSEFDLTMAWRLAGDLKYQLKYGQFSPGAAYPATNRSSETYLRMKISLDL